MTTLPPRVFPPVAARLDAALQTLVADARRRGLPLSAGTIGHSRNGLPILGVEAGEGPLHISITAGAHADEPAGPLAALALVRRMVEEECPDAPALLRRATWRICPHVNPDGAERNAAWFSDPPDYTAYIRLVDREPPGDDVEFNYPDPARTDRAPRPENAAVAAFLRPAAPYHLHLSLHGMSQAEGAWWLIGAGWVDRTVPLRDRLAAMFAARGLGLHDIDRRGEKGFHRIAPGFSTTPTSVAMRAFFESAADPATARLLLPASMEFVASLGGDPLVMVSELPLFRIEGGVTEEGTAYERFRRRLAVARQQMEQDGGEAVRRLAADFGLRPVPMGLQVETLRDAVLMSIEFLEGRESDPPAHTRPHAN